MKVEQISIFIENKSGRLAEITAILGKSGINIRALSLADTSDFGILRLIVDNSEKALKVLKEQRFTVSITNVIGVAVPDSPGGLTSILQILDKSNVNVEYMYAFVERSGDNAVIIFRFDDIDEAISALSKNGVKILPSDRITSI
ncbi:MAG: ACT domain-containing protein [Desulfuromusa sp.]|nr:ACT domain-containing protein [Desulfuromusa sp.]